MDEKQITCIICPLGCKIVVRTDGSNFELVAGNKCKRGVEYARSEALDPRRMLTSSILVISGNWPLVSVKTTKPIPKEMISMVLNKIKNAKVNAPVEIGDVLLEKVCDLDVDIIATKKIEILR